MSETTNGKNEIRLVSPINYMIRGEDDILNIDTTGGITTLHIGNITTNGLDLIRKRIYINDITGNASVNNITINTIGGDTINGLIAFVLNVDGISAEIVIVDKTRYLANLSGDTGGGGGGITSVTATTPITSSGGATPNVSTSIATNRLVGRGTAGTGAMEEIILGTNLSLTGTTLNAVGGGGGGVASVTATAPISSSGGVNPDISITQSSGASNGFLTSIDWTTFNNKGSGTITNVSGTLPISSSGGATPDISISQSGVATNGFLTSIDWNTFNNKGSGTITSVTATTPITSSGGVTPVISTSIATNRLVGRGTAGTGAMEEIILGTNLSLTGTTLNATGGGAGGVTSVSGTLNRIDSSGGTTPIIDISATYVGQTSITTLGTISTGIWNGTTIAVANGGTGVTTSTGSGNNVLSISPTLVTPILGSASATALTFTSTAVSGLTINRLTTAQRQALTPVSGDVVYDTTIGTTCTYNGTFWEYSKEYYVTSFATTTTILASTITGLTTFILEANSTYDISGQFLIGCNGAGGVKFGNTLPAGGLSFINYVGTSTSVTALQQMPSNSGTLIATAINRLTGSSYLTFGGAITTLATAGSVDMQFASGVGGQTSTIYGQFSIGYQSKITLTKIA